jgi:hypothetical protein
LPGRERARWMHRWYGIAAAAKEKSISAITDVHRCSNPTVGNGRVSKRGMPNLWSGSTNNTKALPNRLCAKMRMHTRPPWAHPAHHLHDRDAKALCCKRSSCLDRRSSANAGLIPGLCGDLLGPDADLAFQLSRSRSPCARSRSEPTRRARTS